MVTRQDRVKNEFIGGNILAKHIGKTAESSLW